MNDMLTAQLRCSGALRWSLMVSLVGCSVGPPEPAEGARIGSSALALFSENGLVTNGLVTNGLVTNGLATNGLAMAGPLTNGLGAHGLSATGLASPEFINWFNSNPQDYSDMVMRYVVGCAVPRGQTLSWTNPNYATAYSWPGVLGMAPGWASGDPITELEQQLVSACMGALANKFGVHVQISALSRNGQGVPLPIDPGELTLHSVREACFFGNLFTGDGVFAASDHAALGPGESSVRACGLSSQASGASLECPPIVHTGLCATQCSFDVVGMRYTQCVYNGKAYAPMTTRLQPSQIYMCGDGVCQISERCGTGITYDNCGLDCGACP